MTAVERDLNHKFGALPWHRATLERTFVLFGDNLMANRQPHARAFADRFGGKEWVKQFRFDLTRNAGAVVGNANLNVILVRQPCLNRNSGLEVLLTSQLVF